MKTATLFLIAMACNNAFGETNSPVPTAWLCTSETKLRELTPANGPPQEVVEKLILTGHEGGGTSSAELLSFSSEVVTNLTHSVEAEVSVRDDQDVAIARRLAAEGFFAQKPQPSENLLVRAWDSTVRPEPIRVGKVTIDCTIVTAIKRKNPFCLINAVVLLVTW